MLSIAHRAAPNKGFLVQQFTRHRPAVVDIKGCPGVCWYVALHRLVQVMRFLQSDPLNRLVNRRPT